MEKKVIGVLVDVQHGTVRPYAIIDSLENFYEVLNCDTIDVARRKIGGKYYDIVIDDNGLLKDNPVPAGISRRGEVMVWNNIFICKHDDEGDFVSLNADEIGKVLAAGVLLKQKDEKGVISTHWAIRMEH